MSDLRIHQVSFSGESMFVAFSDERSITVSIAYFPRLQAASPDQRERWQLVGRGLGVHWESVDEDLSIENILSAYSRAKAAEYAHASQP